MITAVADTHTAIWYLYNDPRLSANARLTIETAAQRGDEIGLSAISLVEVIYLEEKGKIPANTYNQLVSALNDPQSVLTEVVINSQVSQAMLQISRAAIPDMPDRIIAATALHLGVPVISRDGKIQLSNIQTIW